MCDIFRQTRVILAGSVVSLLATGCISYYPVPKETTEKTARAPKPDFARLGTNKVYFSTIGTGNKTVILVHGWASNGNFWREQVPALRDKARVILVDLPGHGQSDKPDVNYTVDYLAKAVLAVMHKAAVAKATLVGHSLGVAVICRVYAQAPERVAALVAVDGSLRMPRLSSIEAESRVAPYRKVTYRENVKGSVNSMFPTPGTERLRAEVFGEMIATPQYVLVSTLENSFDAQQPTWELQSVQVPLIILNARSRAWTPDYETYVRSLSARTEYRTFEGVGHFLMLEKPVEFNVALTEMLQEYDLLNAKR